MHEQAMAIDGRTAIDYNHEALRRIVAGLLAMVHAATGGRPAANPASALSLPRHLYLAVLCLLRPAESAARRLIIALARHLPPVPVKSRPVRSPSSIGAVVLRPVVQPGILIPLWARPGAPARKAASARVSFPLLDPLPRPFRRRQVAAGSVPRVLMPGVSEWRALPPPSKPSPADMIDATRVGRRLGALAAVLDDLPAQAARFARWQARRAQDKNRMPRRRMSPLRLGRPPGGRLSRFDPVAPRRRNIREVDEVLAHAHALAVFALERRDTS